MREFWHGTRRSCVTQVATSVSSLYADGMDPPRLEGARSRLREWREDDIESIYSVTDDPVIPLISEVPHGQRDRTAALRFVTSQHKRLAEGRGWGFAITACDDDQVVG